MRLLEGNKNFSAKYGKIEVINAGLEGALSSDELHLYIHKFKYYKPDLVIIHTGGNDAEIYNDTSFTPDYVNFRPVETFQLQRLRMGLPSCLFRSYFISFIVIRFFGHDEIEFERRPAISYPVNWCRNKSKFNPQILPFHDNVSLLVREILRDSSMVLIINFAINKKAVDTIYNSQYITNVETNNTTLRQMSIDYKTLWFDYRSLAFRY